MRRTQFESGWENQMIENTCITCNKIYFRKKSQLGKYCSGKCQQSYKVNNLISEWLAGNDKGWKGKTRQIKPFVRRFMLKACNYACQKCGWDKRHPVDNLPLVEVDHIDGNAENCSIDNLQVLCPNCHSMTPTFRNRNKNSKRNRKVE